jgi:cell division septal protein FtsQ
MKFPLRLKRFGKPKSRTKKKSNHPKLVLIRQIVIGIFLALVLGGLVTGVWYGSRIEKLTIDEIQIIGGETINHTDIEVIVSQELAGSYYHLVPKGFAFTYPEEKIKNKILDIDRVKNVLVERVSGQKITIVFEEYKPIALWCEKLDSKECLFLDKQGFAFGKAPVLEGGAFLRFSEDGVVPEKGQTPFSVDFLNDSNNFIQMAYDGLGLNIIQIEKTADDELVYFISGGGKLKVSNRLTTEQTLENLRTILTSEAFSHIEPGNFQYIDLRYGNRVFVNEELAPTPVGEGASTTASTTVEN